MKSAIKVDKCRACKSRYLTPVLSLGDQYVTNFVDTPEQQGPKIPLNLTLCNEEYGGCGLLQLEHNTPPEMMWGEQYWYKSGISQTIRSDLRDIVINIGRKYALAKGDLILDIGCNDGTLLSNYPEILHRAGFDPSKNVAAEARAKGFDVVNDFFNKESYKKAFGNKKAKVITAISMFYDLEDPNRFVTDITECLDQNGLFVVQQNYAATMLSNNAFDNICHEHLEYHSLSSMEKLLSRHNLEVFDVTQNDINGGSIRTYIRRKGSLVGKEPEARMRVERLRVAEQEQRLDSIETYKNFTTRVEMRKRDLLRFIQEEKKSGKTIAAYGASTRGNVTLQYFGLDARSLDFIADKNSDKWGKKTVGSMIPIISPTEIGVRNPDYLLVLTWHFLNEIKEQEKTWIRRGGRLIAPLPDFQII